MDTTPVAASRLPDDAARTLLVAAGQAPCVALDVAANAASAAALVRRAAAEGAALLVLPELFLSGYELPAIVAHPDQFTVHAADARLDPLAGACAETGITVVVGAPTRDRDTGQAYISAVVIDAGGAWTGQYHKQHLDAAERAAGFSPGSGGCTLTLQGWRLGLAVCWDASFPEHARDAALDGCDAYLVSAMFPGERGERKRCIVGPARALDNALYVVMANHSGRSGPYVGCGGSAVWGPNGREVASAGHASPGIAVARLERADLERARAEDYVLGARSQHGPVDGRRTLVVG